MKNICICQWCDIESETSSETLVICSLRSSNTNLLSVPICWQFIWCPEFLELSPSSSPKVYQPWHFPPSNPLFPAGLPTHLAPSSCTSDSASADHCVHLQIIFAILLKTKVSDTVYRPGFSYIDYVSVKDSDRYLRRKFIKLGNILSEGRQRHFTL